MTLSFQSLGLSEAGVHQLEKLGFTTPTPIQVQAIPELLSGRDVVGQSQTGTGKTAAFSCPCWSGSISTAG
jgi:ATP-dependent RNA helicase DeaD